MAADYTWSCEARVTSGTSLTAEQWLRHVWQDAPLGLRAFLRLGWRFGLGLRLRPGADSSLDVLGWNVYENSPARVSVDADSPILHATNTLVTTDDVLRWETNVTYKNVLGRIVWAPAHVLHQWLVPPSIRRAIRDRAPSASR